MSTTRIVIHPGDEPTEEQLQKIREAAKRPVTYDEDCPPLTDEQLAKLAEQVREQRAKMKKPVVSLRIAPRTLVRARATGKGYTGFLSRLLDLAIDDPELVRKALETR